MNQFGHHMHFLQFKQVLTFIYALKIHFCDYFLFSQVSRSGPKFQKGQGPRRKKSQDSERTLSGPRVVITEEEGFICKLAQPKGADGSRPSD